MRPANEALLVIDVQNDFCPKGALAVTDGDTIVPLINDMLGQYQTRVFTQDWHLAGHASFASSHADRAPFEMIEMPYGPQVLWPDHCIQGSNGAAFHPDLRTDSADVIIRKGMDPSLDSYSAFFENDHVTPTGLAGYLSARGITLVRLVGLATDYCVFYSALDAAGLGLDVEVDRAACRAIDLDGSLKAAEARMVSKGIKLL
ncbi:bifunctional nicotinamidase/pyrazinamidase [Falsihalocynthiibacter arcticus]|uniref:Nicotinamidase n=1 Tax=Falsihalocynthiibacter arcticus TaxID=1579316 RepID=A0A126UY24_9RHOB|nr:bifunctional nicotinamidase/pyrazinamidase [Falsihalocynthiibacter arcticus]AML50973.1 nicotinamidase [Falsihalocynthiibacter arcticus]